MERGFQLNYSSLPQGGGRALVFSNYIDAFHGEAALGRQDGLDRTSLSGVLAGDDLYRIVPSNVH
jgi:hypothetical protein